MKIFLALFIISKIFGAIFHISLAMHAQYPRKIKPIEKHSDVIRAVVAGSLAIWAIYLIGGFQCFGSLSTW